MSNNTKPGRGRPKRPSVRTSVMGVFFEHGKKGDKIISPMTDAAATSWSGQTKREITTRRLGAFPTSFKQTAVIERYIEITLTNEPQQTIAQQCALASYKLLTAEAHDGQLTESTLQKIADLYGMTALFVADVRKPESAERMRNMANLSPTQCQNDHNI